jgi:putative transposase
MQPQRRSIRIKDYDYSQANIYFVTICIHKQIPVLGVVKNEKVALSEIGKIVDSNWQNISAHYSNVTLDDYIIMPDHLHGLIVVQDIYADAINGGPTKKATLASIVSGFKSGVTRELGKSRLAVQYPLWQRNYFEHVIRNQAELNKICQYIKNNPLVKTLRTSPYPEDV